jgi:hypothetical protein
MLYPIHLFAASPLMPFAGLYQGTLTIETSNGAGSTTNTDAFRFHINGRVGSIMSNVKGYFQKLVFQGHSQLIFLDDDGNTPISGRGSWRIVGKDFIRFRTTGDAYRARFIKGQMRLLGSLLIISTTEYSSDNSWTKYIYRLNRLEN